MTAARHLAPVLMTAQRGGNAAPTPAKMSFFDLQAKFWQLHEEANFTASETHLYFFLLHQFNAARWPAKLFRKRNQVAADAGLDFKTVDKTRAKLVARGLLTYDPGNKSLTAAWALSDGVPIEGKISPQSDMNSSQIEGNNSPAFGTNKPDCSQIEGKISPPYKEEEKDTLTTTRKDQVQEKTKTLPLARRWWAREILMSWLRLG
jgi:hypothetical protein